MQFQQPFDARTVNPADVFMPLPVGDYKVIITESEPQATSKGDGGMLVLKHKVVEGQYAGRELKRYLNLWNPNPQTCEIAQRELSAICHVTGVFNIAHSEQLHNIPFIIIVGIQTGGRYNEINGVKDLAGNMPGKGGVAGVAAAVPPAPAGVAVAPQGWGAPAPAAAPVAPVAPVAQGWGPPATAPAQPQYAPPAAQPAAPAAWGAPPPAPAAAPPANAGVPPWQQAPAAAAPPAAFAPPAAAPGPPVWKG